MYTPKKKDYAYKFGCGRYIQESGAVKRTATEVLRLNCKKAVIVGGKTALSVALNGIKASLEEKNVAYVVKEHNGYCSFEAAYEISDLMKSENCDIVIGVGGGKIMDLAKAIAAIADTPVINIPTSAATCAACTPLSVMYTEQGQTVPGSTKHRLSVNAVLVDIDFMLTQPPRLLIAGAYDSMAKYIETAMRIKGKTEDEMQLGIDYAFLLSKQIYEDIRRLLPEALETLKNGVTTKAFEKLVYINLGVTGVISGIAKGSGQTAFAHEFYEAIRTVFTKEAASFIHGELVGMALALQLDYNGDPEKIAGIRELLTEYGLPVFLKDINVEPTEENLKKLFDDMAQTSSMESEGVQGRIKLMDALHVLV